MQAAGGVDDHHVAAGADRVVGDRGRVGAVLAADEARAGTPGPDLELLLGGGAEGVGGAEGHLAAVLAQLLGELADRRRLAGAVDADDEDHRRALSDLERGRRPKERRDLLGQRGVEVGEVLPGLETPDELGRRANADVRAEQRFLEPLPGGRIRRIEGDRSQLLGQRTAGARQRVAEAAGEPAARDLCLIRPLGIAEELSPAPRHRPRKLAAAEYRDAPHAARVASDARATR